MIIKPKSSTSSTETGEVKGRKVPYFSLLGGFVIGALVVGAASSLFISDAAALREQISKLSGDLYNLLAKDEAQVKHVQSDHRVAVNALDKQLKEQKNLVPDVQYALDKENALVGSKESGISELNQEIAEFETQQQKKDVKISRSMLSKYAPGLQMMAIPAGSFLMGSPKNEVGRNSNEGPQREVAISAFELSDSVVTFEQYEQFANETKRVSPDDKSWERGDGPVVVVSGIVLPMDESWGRGERLVINISWQGAIDYIAWLNEKTASNFRLPSEAEWEYAVRGGTTTPFYSGDCISTKQANYNGNYDYNNCGANTDEYLDQTSLVKSYEANSLGLYDMVGNVWEWTQDCWHNDYVDAPQDGSAWLETDNGDCSHRVTRGGAWFVRPELLRSAARHSAFLEAEFYGLGFRLARTP